MWNLSIKSKLALITALATIFLIIIGIYTFSSFNKIQRLNQLSENMHGLNETSLDLRKNEKDFLLSDLFDANYFKTKESKYISTIKSDLSTIKKTLDSLKNSKDINQFNLNSDISSLIDIFNQYNTKLQSIEENILTKGYLNYGLIGNFRLSAHNAEKSIKQLSNQNDLMVHLLMLRRHEKDYFLRKDTLYYAKFNSRYKQFLSDIKRKNNISSSQKQEIISSLAEYQNSFAKVHAINNAIGLNENQGLTKELHDAAQEIQPNINKVLFPIESKSQDAINATVRNVILLIAFIIVFLLFVVLSINKTITNSINTTMEAVNKIAEGNLNISIDKVSKDEMGKLLKSLLSMNQKLRNIIENINSGAANIVLASQQLSSVSQQVSQGANEQASSIEEVSSSVEEMVSNIQQSTDNANLTGKISSVLIDAVHSVSEASNVSLTSIQEIANKITIITDIAFQTNILALNAAVEAARADKHGKGFAVVAAEVRKLAERSKLAADDINTLSKSGVLSTENTKNSIEKLAPEIEKAIRLIEEIVASSNEQNSGAKQINSATQQLNQVTQQNAAVSEELATSAEEMTSQAEELKDSISYFRL